MCNYSLVAYPHHRTAHPRSAKPSLYQHREVCSPSCSSTHTCSTLRCGDMNGCASMCELSDWLFHSAQRSQLDRINVFGAQMANDTGASLPSISGVRCCSPCTTRIASSSCVTCPCASTQTLYYCRRELLNFFSTVHNTACPCRKAMYVLQPTMCNFGVHLTAIEGCAALTHNSEICSCSFIF